MLEFDKCWYWKYECEETYTLMKFKKVSSDNGKFNRTNVDTFIVH